MGVSVEDKGETTTQAESTATLRRSTRWSDYLAILLAFGSALLVSKALGWRQELIEWNDCGMSRWEPIERTLTVWVWSVVAGVAGSALLVRRSSSRTVLAWFCVLTFVAVTFVVVVGEEEPLSFLQLISDCSSGY